MFFCIFAGKNKFFGSMLPPPPRCVLDRERRVGAPNTLVHQPHDGPIVQLAYHDSLDLLATVGRDRRVKLWALRPTEKGKLWACQRTLTNPPGPT